MRQGARGNIQQGVKMLSGTSVADTRDMNRGGADEDRGGLELGGKAAGPPEP